MTIELPPDVQARYLAAARAQGVPVEQYLRDRLIEGVSIDSTALMTPEQRARAFRDWAEKFPPTPLLSDEAVSRESLYKVDTE